MGNKKAASGKVDHFLRLPKELVVDIFDRVGDLKSLFWCALVSKYFAALIPHVRTITIALPYTKVLSPHMCTRLLTLFRELHKVESRWISLCLDFLSLQHLKLPVFLDKFSKVESIYLEYNFVGEIRRSSSLIMWKATCGNRSDILESFIAVLPAIMYKDDEPEFDPEHDEHIDHLCKCTLVKDCYHLSFGRYTEWLCVICMLLKTHSSLKSVTVTDSTKRGKLVIKDDQLVSVRDCLLEGDWNEIGLRTNLRCAWIPYLHLPESGYIMEGVYMLLVKGSTTPSASGASDEDLIGWDFEEHENLLGEAVKEILTKHRHRIQILE